jgi:hypothetical protein
MKKSLTFILFIITLHSFAQYKTYLYTEKEVALKVKMSDGNTKYVKSENVTGSFKHYWEVAQGSMSGKDLFTIYDNGLEIEYFVILEEKGYKELSGKIYKHSIVAPSKTDTQLGISIYKKEDMSEIMLNYPHQLVIYRKGTFLGNIRP